MTSLGWQFLALAVGALQALAHAVPGALQNDAGSGADAPDQPDDALALAAGAYLGNLTPRDDADWYTLGGQPREPSCFEARATLAGLADATLALAPSLEPATTQRAWPGLETTLALATPNPNGVWLGLAPTEAEGLGELAAGTYRFELQRFGHGELGAGDAGTGGDAGATPDDALPAPVGCFGGSLDGAQGDLLDVFTFDAGEGDRATLSLTNGINQGTILRLLSPSGEEVQSVTPGNVTKVALNETGLWQIQLSHRAPTFGQYMVALSMDTMGPPEEACRPTCVGW